MESRKQFLLNMLGKSVHVTVDRPVGHDHHGIRYPVNYGYISGMMAGDGEEQDVYILGISHPLSEFDGVIVGGVLRKDDCEDKLVAAPAGMDFSREEIARAVYFQEQYFDSEVITP